MDRLVRRSRDNILFCESFQAVSQGLKDAVGPNAIGSIAILNATEAFAFENGSESKEPRKRPDQCGHRYEGRDKGLPGLREEGDELIFEAYKKLIHVLSPVQKH